MSSSRRLPLAALLLVVAVPPVWLACGGGESKPPETPASESSAAASSEAPAASDSAAPAASESAAPAADTAPEKSPSTESTAASTPPPPAFKTTDCGKCVDKTCKTAVAACAKNSDCQTALDGIESCTSAAATCIDSATEPSGAKPKKLADAVTTCAKKAIGKACKAKCQ